MIKIFTLLLLFTTLPMIGTDSKSNVQNELRKNNQIIKQKKKQEKSILKELGNLRKNIYLTQKKLNRAYKRYNSYHQQIKDTEAKLKKEQAELRQTKKYLNQKILALYKEQNRPVIQLLFNSESFSSLLNNMYFYEKVIESDYFEMVQAKQKIDDFKINKRKLEYSKSKANSLKHNILKQRYQLKHTKKIATRKT